MKTIPIKSDTFCVLPFMAIDRHYDILRPCCMNDIKSWQPNVDLWEYWNSDRLTDLRQNLLNGIQDPSCQRCWYQENGGQSSLRQAANHSRLDTIDVNQPKIKQVKLLTGNTCNLSCMMCFSTISTTYQQLWQDDPTWIMPEVKQTPLNYDWMIDQYIRDHAQDLEFIEALGGEPLFSKDFLDLLDYLIQHEHASHITLFIITNGTLLTDNILEKLQKFHKTVFVVSVDGVGRVNEYQRWPSRWTTVEENLSVISGLFDLSILPTLTAINLPRINELIEYCDKKKYSINNISPADHWPSLLPRHLPNELKKFVPREFDYLIQDQGSPDLLLDFISKWDQKRKIRIADYLPEWSRYF